jgi:phospholipase/lecithinase/hemolysin
MYSFIRRSREFAWALALPLLFLTTLASAQISRPDISNIYVFGDSLSDGGAGIGLINIGCRDEAVASFLCGQQRASVRLGTPFYQGRSLADGPVAVDVMARLLGKTLRPGYYSAFIPGVDRAGENYAIAGAHAHGDELAVRPDGPS